MASVCEIGRMCDFVSYWMFMKRLYSWLKFGLTPILILTTCLAYNCHSDKQTFQERFHSRPCIRLTTIYFNLHKQNCLQRFYSRPYVHLTFNRLIYTWCLLELNNTFFRAIFYFKEWYKVIRGKLSRGKPHLGHITVAIGRSDVLTPTCRSTTFPTVRTHILHVVGHGRVVPGLPS